VARRSLIDISRNKEEIVHLLVDAGWGSRTVSRYLEMKHSEVIPASSLRTWRARYLKRLESQGKLPAMWKQPDHGDHTARAEVNRALFPDDTVPDILAQRLALIRLQQRRIAIDAEHEFAMNKLFVSQGKEIDLLNRLLNDAKTDLQDIGVYPKVEVGPAVVVNNAVQAIAAAAPLADAMPNVPADVIREAGRTLVLLRREEEENHE
jgi:hypothetical protein